MIEVTTANEFLSLFKHKFSTVEEMQVYLENGGNTWVYYGVNQLHLEPSDTVALYRLTPVKLGQFAAEAGNDTKESWHRISEWL